MMGDDRNWFEDYWVDFLYRTMAGKVLRGIWCKAFGHSWYWNWEYKKYCRICQNVIPNNSFGKKVN